MSIWFFWALVSVFGTAIANILRKIVVKDDTSDPIASAIVFQFLGSAILAVFALWHGFKMPPITHYPLNYALQAILWGISTICLFKATQYIESSEVTIITTAESIVIIVSAIFFLGERFTLLNGVGTALIIAAIVIFSLKKDRIKLNKGVAFALAYCLFAGLAITNDTYTLKTSTIYSYLTIGFLTPGILIALIQPKALKKIPAFFKFEQFKKIFVFTLLYTLAGIAFFLSLEAGAQASQLGPINQSSVILTVILAALFLNERDHWIKKVICTILVTIGVFLLK